MLARRDVVAGAGASAELAQRRNEAAAQASAISTAGAAGVDTEVAGWPRHTARRRDRKQRRGLGWARVELGKVGCVRV